MALHGRHPVAAEKDHRGACRHPGGILGNQTGAGAGKSTRERRPCVFRGRGPFRDGSVLVLWFTVVFANFAEAMAEARGKAQADALRKTKADTIARKLLPNEKFEM